MFKFKGIQSDKMGVIIEEEEHFIAKARQRYETLEIEGKDGAIFESLGYSYIERPIKIQIIDISKLDDILAWLNGVGEFEYKGRKTVARFFSELSPNRSANIKIIDTNFIRDPFWYKADDEYIEIIDKVSNEGNIESRPIIKLEKKDSNSVDLTINNSRFIYDFKEDEYVEIDCDEKTVTYDNLNRNRQIQIDFEFPKLKIGENIVTINSGDCSIKIKRKDRWL